MSAVVTARPLRVVIIDDTPDLRELLRIALTRGGFEVVGEAGDGRAGIETVREHLPELILLDLAMPVMDGIEALPTLRRLVPEAKIVVLSGFGAQQMSSRAVAAGADGYVQKGAPLTTILDYVRDVAAGSGRPARSLSVVPGWTPAVDAEPSDRPAPAPSTAPAPDPPAPDPAAADPAAPDPAAAGSGPAPDAQRGATSNASAWEAMRLAPYGVVEVTDEPAFRIVHTNPVAERLLGGAAAGAPGTPLATVAPDLATLVAYHRLDPDASFEAPLGGGRVRASLRRTGWSVLVFLDPTSEDVGLLRRAIATTAHEVRGPVAVLCGIAETLAWDAEHISVDQSRRLMESVARQARILDRITADLLTAAQIQRGTLRVDHRAVEPESLIISTIEGRWDVDLQVEDHRDVRADPLRLEQMLTNLMSNAHKYGAPPFVIRVRPEGDLVAIDVIDHGDGVPPGFRDQLFREFARADGTVTTGIGLGLYVVHTLALAQNGSVSYAPGPGGRGSVFTIRLLAC